MKYFYLAVFAILLSACSTQRVEVQEFAPNACTHEGTVTAYKCGFFIQLDNGVKIHPEKGVDENFQKDGMRVKVGFQVQHQKQTNTTTGGCSSGDNEQSTYNPIDNACGVMLANLLCLEG